MPSKPWRFLLLILILLVFFQLGSHGSSAETAYTATLTSPDITEFPRLTAYLDVHDPSGAFVHGLTPQDVTMLENEVQLPVAELRQVEPGVQFVLAVTPGESFIIRDSQGVSRYEYLLQGLLAGTWVGQSAGGDDFSLLTLGGPQVTHTSDSASIRSALESYLPADPDVVPSLEVLSSALQVASDPLDRPGMERAILFITPPQVSEVSLGLQSIIASANQQDIRIHVWLVGAQELFALPETDLLRNLAAQTGGSFFAFSRDEVVPDLETLFDPSRYVYQLGYDSQVSTAGTHQVAVQVMTGGELVVSNPQSFELNIQPSAPAFLSLPAEIVRSYSSLPTPGEGVDQPILIPAQQDVSIQVTFPDGHERPLTRSSLYVDGTLQVENTAPPYDTFVWDISVYLQDGMHTLSVEVLDNLGMTGSTGDVQVTILVPESTQAVMVAFSQRRLLLVGVVVLVSAAVLLLVLIIGGRIRPRPHPGQVRGQAGSSEKILPVGYRERMRQRKDPVTQPVKIASVPPVQTQPRPKSWRARLPWARVKEAPTPAIAYLVPLAGSDEPTLPAPLQITSDDVTLGRDPLQASLVITDPSLQGLHARIHHEGNTFLITDAESVAGSWVNFQRVPPEGTQLEHADIIHLGGVGFRFNLPHPERVRKIVVTTLEPDR